MKTLMKKMGTVQGGELLLRSTALGAWGLLVGNEKVITQSIYWNTKLDMICALEELLEVLTVDIEE